MKLNAAVVALALLAMPLFAHADALGGIDAARQLVKIFQGLVILILVLIVIYIIRRKDRKYEDKE